MSRISRRAALALLALPGAARARALRSNDEVHVLPSLLHRDAQGALQLRIEAWVFERERNPTRTRLLAKALGLEWDAMNSSQRARFQARAALFGADDKDGRELSLLRAGHGALALPASDAQGYVRAAVPHGREPRAGRWIDWSLASGARRFPGRAQWIGDAGLSVVTDIDDTIKHTQVRERREMLLNTFAREFVAVPGMAAWFGRIAHAAPNAAFHYVSGSPVQLLPALLPFVRGSGFAEGSWHLRPLALFDQDATSRHKHETIAQLLADHPQRRFVLVGDSGERDPEVYGEVARAHAARIAALLIRNVTGEDEQAPRYAQAFADVPRERWRVFTDPSALPVRWR